MTIICLEGASGIGKSTAATYMSREYGYERIPEVNELFSRPLNAASDWYFEMQVKRWAMAADISASGGVAILDGDHLQPVWYNWIFADSGLQPVSEVLAFYQHAFANGDVGFPDAYVVLTLGIDELRARKESDQTRRRRNFEAHLKLIAPQQVYFDALAKGECTDIRFIPSTSPAFVADTCRSMVESGKRVDNTADFTAIEAFMASKVTE